VGREMGAMQGGSDIPIAPSEDNYTFTWHFLPGGITSWRFRRCQTAIRELFEAVLIIRKGVLNWEDRSR